MTPSKQQIDIPVGFHMGAIIMIIARTYATLEDVINELAQNIIDAGATRGLIEINFQKRKLKTLDNGKGCSVEEIKNRIGKIGARMKSPDDIGEMGIGNLSPIGIGKKYSMITHPRGVKLDTPFFRVVLDRSLVVGRETVSFQHEPLPGFKFSEPGWTTSVSVADIEPSALRGLERELDPVGKICDRITASYGTKIKEKKIKITVRIINPSGESFECVVTPQDFPGRKQVIIIDTKLGPVTFEMYLTYQKQKKPVILVDHQGRFRFPLSNMDIWKEISDVFGSGYLQGTIRTDFCQLAENRRDFVWSDNLEFFLTALLQFANNYGRPWLNKMEENKDVELFEAIGAEVVASATDIIKEHPDLLSALFRGAVSASHVGTGRAPDEEQLISTRRIKKPKRNSDVPPLVDRDFDEEKSSTRRRERKSVIHSGIASKTGTKRRAVIGQAGLQLIQGEGIGYRVRIGTEGEEAGKIVINITHPDYRESQFRGKTALDTYMRLLVMATLSKPLIPDQRADIFAREFEDVFLQFRKMITPAIFRR